MASHPKRRRSEPMDCEEEEHWSDNHQILLQYLMHTRVTKQTELSAVHRKLFQGAETLANALSAITDKIKPLKMDIKQTKCDITGVSCYVLIHTTGEPFFPRCCFFGKSQLEFLKQILTAIVLSDDGKIGKIGALNTCKTMSKSDAEECIGLFVNEKILLEIDNGGKLCLSPLAITEFAPYFNQCFPDNVATCDLCKQLVFVGRVCESARCSTKFHTHCLEKWLEKRSFCPSCSHQWKSGGNDRE